MNKAELIDSIAKINDISRAAAGRSLDGVLTAIIRGLKSEDTVAITGFGTFKVTARKARIGRNPRTGEAAKIKAARVPRFAAGKTLKEEVN